MTEHASFFTGVLAIMLMVTCIILAAMWVTLPVIIYLQLRKINDSLKQLIEK